MMTMISSPSASALRGSAACTSSDRTSQTAPTTPVVVVARSTSSSSSSSTALYPRRHRHRLLSSRSRSGSVVLRPPSAANMPGVPDQEALKKAMEDPAVQKQVAEMTAAMQSEKVQKRFEELRNDPDLKPMFEDIQKGGMPALMKYMNDPEWLAKVGNKMGDVAEMMAAGAAGGGGGGGGGAAPGAAAAPAAAIPTVNNLFDAAKAGDLEAVEDFVAIGRDPSERDEGKRTPLHYATAYGHADVARELVRAGADLEAKDDKGNTPLHYAAGYGRSELVSVLVGAGADGAAENSDGRTPLGLVTGEPRNPLNADKDALGVLENAELAGAEKSL